MMFSRYFTFPELFQRILLMTGLSFSLSACTGEGTSTSGSQQISQQAGPGLTEILEMTYAGMGGREALSHLRGYSMEATRERYVMGMATGPGEGLFKSVVSKVMLEHDIATGNIRFDFDHTNLYGLTITITELVTADAGYIIGRDDIYGEAQLSASAMGPGRRAMAIKTERLLNPHLLILEVISDPARASIAPHDSAGKGTVLGEDAVYPVALTYDGVTGQRTLLTNGKWLQKWQGTDFVEQASAGNIVENSSWHADWQAGRDIDESTHYQVVLQDEIAPITLFVHKETGRINKLQTLEHDWGHGDVSLEVTYHHWQSHAGVDFPQHIKVSVAGTPALDVTRSDITVNPEFDLSRFAEPEGVAYLHDDEIAARGARTSQWILGLAHAGSPRRVGRPQAIEATEFRPGLYFLRSVPDDAIRTMVVEQSESVIVVDPGFEDLKAEEMIKWIKANIPGKPVKHAILTHHHVDHAGGIRALVAEGANLIVHERAEQYQAHNLNRTNTIIPDALDRNRVATEVIAVPEEGSYVINDAQNTVGIYPAYNGHAEDMVIVTVTGGAQSIVYNGDLYSPGDKVGEVASEVPLTGFNLEDAIKKSGLKVDFIVGSHARLGYPVRYISYEEFKRHLEFHTPGSPVP